MGFRQPGSTAVLLNMGSYAHPLQPQPPTVEQQDSCIACGQGPGVRGAWGASGAFGGDAAGPSTTLSWAAEDGGAWRVDGGALGLRAEDFLHLQGTLGGMGGEDLLHLQGT